MTRSVIVVEPAYGWGWTDGEATIATPGPFKALLTSSGSQLHGEVTDPTHPYNGSTVSLSRRHALWDGSVNVAVGRMNQPTIYGYATIPLECFS